MVKEVGPLRFVLADTMMPLAATIWIMLLAGVPLHTVYGAASAGGAVALMRLWGLTPMAQRRYRKNARSKR
jgi:hypothetical protein